MGRRYYFPIYQANWLTLEILNAYLADLTYPMRTALGPGVGMGLSHRRCGRVASGSSRRGGSVEDFWNKSRHRGAIFIRAASARSIPLRECSSPVCLTVSSAPTPNSRDDKSRLLAIADDTDNASPSQIAESYHDNFGTGPNANRLNS